MYNHNKAQQSKNRVHISWNILYLEICSQWPIFANDTFKCILLSEQLFSLIQILLKFGPKGSTNINTLCGLVMPIDEYDLGEQWLG